MVSCDLSSDVEEEEQLHLETDGGGLMGFSLSPLRRSRPPILGEPSSPSLPTGRGEQSLTGSSRWFLWFRLRPHRSLALLSKLLLNTLENRKRRRFWFFITCCETKRMSAVLLLLTTVAGETVGGWMLRTRPCPSLLHGSRAPTVSTFLPLCN